MPVTNYIWEDDNIVQEVDENGNVLVDYTYEPGPSGRLISEHRGGVSKFYHFDGEGNTLSLTDMNGDVTDTFAYAAFGEETARTGTTPTPFRYHGEQGYYWDEDTGDYIVRARPLSPEYGRWLAADPSGFIDGLNLYMYVHNRATMFADPSGHQGVAGVIPCTPESCGKCLNKAMGPKGEGGDEAVSKLIFFLKKLAEKEPSCDFDINCCAPKSEDKRCAPCDVPFGGLRGQLLDPKTNKDYKGKSQIILCSKAFVVFPGGAAPPFDKFGECQDVVETIRQELLHLLDRCSKFDEKKDKCEACVCDELRGHYYSGQCKPGSVWWVIKGGRPKPFESVIDCLTWSAANSCLGVCGAKAAEDLVAKVKTIYGTCKASPSDVDNPLPPLNGK
jgi:RHS repeat-associated protein